MGPREGPEEDARELKERSKIEGVIRTAEAEARRRNKNVYTP